MHTPFDFKADDASNLVYVRPVAVADLPDEVQNGGRHQDNLRRAQSERRASGPRQRPQARVYSRAAERLCACYGTLTRFRRAGSGVARKTDPLAAQVTVLPPV